MTANALSMGQQPELAAPTWSRSRPDLLWSLPQGVILAGAYGAVLELGDPAGHVLGFALAVPATITLAMTVALPPLFVVLAMQGAPIGLPTLSNSALMAFRYISLTLGGLTPTLLLLSTSIDERNVVYGFALAGLWFSGLIGAYRLVSETSQCLIDQGPRMRLPALATLCGFVWLAFAFADKLWRFALLLIGDWA